MSVETVMQLQVEGGALPGSGTVAPSRETSCASESTQATFAQPPLPAALDSSTYTGPQALGLRLAAGSDCIHVQVVLLPGV